MRHLSAVLLFLSVAVIAPQEARAQPNAFPPPPPQARTIVCESQDGSYRECPTNFRGPAMLVENISSTPCVEGRSWGNGGRGSVWVRGGCRGRFAEAGGPPGAPGGPGLAGGPGPVPPGPGPGPIGGPGGFGGPGGGALVRCESDNGRYRECHIPGHARIQLVRQLSSSACREGRTWGTRGNRVWVTQGCRAEFSAIGGAWVGRGWGGSIICASDDQRTVTCPWSRRLGRPRLLEQVSSTTCREGYNWGQTRSGDIWVSRGCRGRFGGN